MPPVTGAAGGPVAGPDPLEPPLPAAGPPDRDHHALAGLRRLLPPSRVGARTGRTARRRGARLPAGAGMPRPGATDR